MKKSLILASVFVMVLFFGNIAYALTAREIIKKSQDITRSKSSKGTMEMIIIKPEWKRTLEMKFWEDGKDKFFARIIAPAKEKGIGSLKIGANMWNYLPKTEKVMKIPPSLMLQPWLGSDFTNDDLVKESNVEDDYTHKLLEDTKINGIMTYKIELVPKPEAPVVWGKIIFYVDKSNFLPVKEEFFSEKGELVRVMNFSDVKKMHDRLIPTKMEMIPLNKKGQKTVIIQKDVQFDIPIPADIFSLRNLKEKE